LREVFNICSQPVASALRILRMATIPDQKGGFLLALDLINADLFNSLAGEQLRLTGCAQVVNPL
jgi:hypothetical protein